MNITDVSIDLETLDTGTNATILSIGACAFNRYMNVHDNKLGSHIFYQNIELADQDGDSRSISQDTLQWWLTKTSNEAREALFVDAVPLHVALGKFWNWFLGLNIKGPTYSTVESDVCVWGNGISFDLGILKDTWCGVTPWKFWAERDLRTLKDLPFIDWHKIDNELKPEFAHRADHDALNQAHTIAEVYQQMKEKFEVPL